MAEEATRIRCSIDLTQPGKQLGYLAVSHSNNQHAYGVIPVPIVCIANGEGPTALVSAGNHGDEHEGPLVARRLVRDLDESDITGRLLIMPSLNHPAVLADSRVSPLDEGNMNRAYPGNAAGTATFAIVSFVELLIED